MTLVEQIPAEKIPASLPTLISLRAITYRGYPYLYEQNLDDEEEYVRQFSSCKESIFIQVRKNGSAAGMISGLPLAAAQEWIQDPFLQGGEPVAGIFYIAEVVFAENFLHDAALKDQLLDTMEKAAAARGFEKTAVCEVYRSGNDTANAAMDAYWSGRGYRKQENLKSVFSWKDIGQTEKTPKELIYWIKPTSKWLP